MRNLRNIYLYYTYYKATVIKNDNNLDKSISIIEITIKCKKSKQSILMCITSQ